MPIAGIVLVAHETSLHRPRIARESLKCSCQDIFGRSGCNFAGVATDTACKRLSDAHMTIRMDGEGMARGGKDVWTSGETAR
jgi:hypothetical protein